MKRRPLIGMAILALLSLPVATAARELSPDRAVQFDIQAQPLAAALARYGDIAGREVFYQAGLVEGRMSSSVAGRLAAADALALLLSGTGLRARFLDDGSFVLSLPPAQDGAAGTLSSQSIAQRYYGQIQVAVRESFCRQRGLEPGTLRAVALIWIGASGAVERVQQLSSSGGPVADRNIEAAFLNVRLDERPPTEFAQPALIMMTPQTPGTATACRHDIGPMQVRP